MKIPEELSPSERLAAAKSRMRYVKVRSFAQMYNFPFDDFQTKACEFLEEGHGVLVAAPTGAGKTIVGEFAAYLALQTGRRCFYTAPIKALSNQKYQDLKAMFGEGKVGLLTGDTNINSEADIVVMTTEVLRNMLYASPSALHDLGFVVMDEVHYLADRFRGAVWEEVLIHLADSVQVVSLSATVSNAEEFGDWLQAVRGSTEVILSENRPVPLYQHVLFGNRMLDLFAENGKLNPEILSLEKEAARKVRVSPQGKNHKSSREWRWPDTSSSSGKNLSRPEVIEKLDREGMLPAITFIFSRAVCAAAVKQCVDSGLVLTNAEERSQIRELAFSKTNHIPEEDLVVLGFHEWLEALERGIAAHHAGMLPTFKEVVEELFQRGLVRAVFATETLALGINMPAKTVVLEKLSKWNGEGHVAITPGEFTQLTGRAGRRGIDIEGNAVVIWNRDLDSASLAGLASTRTYPLRSSFKPTYNMTINLISQLGADRARTSLEASFAQYQADKAVVGLSRQIHKNEDVIGQLRTNVECHLGDFFQYTEIKEELRDFEKGLSKNSKKKRALAEERIIELRRALRAHPCHGCADREQHARLADRAARLIRENKGLQDRVSNRTDVIARRFDLVQIMLREFGYLDSRTITPIGRLLAKIYGETDLLIAELVRKDVLVDLNATELVSVISALVFEARKDESPKIPYGKVQETLAEVVGIWHEIHERELDLGLEPMREPDLGFCWASHRWASGHSLSSIVRGTEMTVGDFVRSMKQIIDLLRQLGNAAPQLSEVVQESLRRVDRGVVTYAGVVG
jgi:ATP-dependent RNA helicase HelY